MVCPPVVCPLFRSRVTSTDDCLDVSANVIIAFDLDLDGIACCDNILENYIYDVLVKDLYIAK